MIFEALLRMAFGLGGKAKPFLRMALGPGGKAKPFFTQSMRMEIDALPPFELLEQRAKAPTCGRGRRAYDQGLHRTHQARMERHMYALVAGGKNRPFFTRRMRMKINALGRLELLDKLAAEADEKARVAPWWSAPYWGGRRDAHRMVAERIRRALGGDNAAPK